MSLISTTNKLYLTDPMVHALMESVQIELDEVLQLALKLERQYWIDTADDSIRAWEQHFAIKIVSSVLEDRRNAVQAKMWSFGDVDITLIQSVANAWRNGEVSVQYVDEEIKLSFVSTIGIPQDLTSLLAAIEEIIPAHFGLSYTLNYLLIRDVEAMTLDQLETQLLSNFAF